MDKRILVVNVNWLGDVIFSTPFIRALREAYPDSYIACLLHPRCKDVLEGNPCLNEIIVYDEESAHKSVFGKLKLVRLLRSKHFDTAFILHRSFTKALLTFLAGIPERIGYATKNRARLLTKAIEEDDYEIHKVEYFLNLARAVGIKPKNLSYEFFIKNSDRNYIADILKREGVVEKDIIVTICPGGNWDPKRWPEESFAKLSDALIEKFGAKIAIAGAKKDVKLAMDIKSIMKNKPVIMCGNTSLKQLGALFERSRLVIANDTGPMHIAVAAGSKVIALFGPTSPKITGPYGGGNYRVISKDIGCEVPCYDVTCSDNKCMSAITVEDVFKEAEKML